MNRRAFLANLAVSLGLASTATAADIAKFLGADIGSKAMGADASSLSSIMGLTVVSTPAAAWAAWNQLNIATIQKDLIFAVACNTAANTNLTAGGLGLTGANLILTDVNANVPAATGTPPYKQLGPDAMGFSYTTGFADAVFDGSGPIHIIQRFADISNASASTDYTLIFTNGTFNATLGVAGTALKTNGFYTEFTDQSSSLKIDGTSPPATAITSSGDVWFFMGVYSDAIYVGFTHSGKPTKWSDFPTDQRKSYSGSVNIPNSGVGGSNAYMFKYPVASRITAKGYYTICAKTELIDINS
jgi:hypothetical protein